MEAHTKAGHSFRCPLVALVGHNNHNIQDDDGAKEMAWEDNQEESVDKVADKAHPCRCNTPVAVVVDNLALQNWQISTSCWHVLERSPYLPETRQVVSSWSMARRDCLQCLLYF